MSQLIFTILFISGFGALLALLLELADVFIANYGECQITINQEKKIVVKGGSPLLFSLQEEGIFIPSACGGKGTCAYCKVTVLEGSGPVLPTETPYLSAQELREHVRLSCQVKVRNDLRIEIPEDLFSIKEFNARVVSISNLTPYIKKLILEILSPDEGIAFKPGQYIQLEVPKYKLSKGSEYRAFSIASSPDEHDEIELYVGLVEKGVVSTYIHDFLMKGDEITIRGPFGDFYYRDSDRDILMIATGTGLAPMMSILRNLLRKKTQKKIILFFGTRTEEDLYCVEELKGMQNQLPEFRYIPTLSRAKEDSAWRGERGRVTALIEKHIPEGANMDVYICGNPEMVESCLEVIEEKGIPEDRIYFDKFA
jgi:Na+-transporting NADH:ubiquinone oxidoreductase subunit F